jgi:hypothetical protein
VSTQREDMALRCCYRLFDVWILHPASSVLLGDERLVGWILIGKS